MVVVSITANLRRPHSLRFVIGLLQWHKVCKLGGDELHRPLVVALKGFKYTLNVSLIPLPLRNGISASYEVSLLIHM